MILKIVRQWYCEIFLMEFDFTVMIQNDFVEHSSGRFSALILVNSLASNFFQGQRISDRFACGLNGELVMNIADGVPLAVDGAN